MSRKVSDILKQKNRECDKERQQQRLKLKKLMELADNDHIFSERDEEFIRRVNNLFNEGKILTSGQTKYLDDCFNKY